jgi:hypothetical protein
MTRSASKARKARAQAPAPCPEAREGRGAAPEAFGRAAGCDAPEALAGDGGGVAGGAARGAEAGDPAVAVAAE